MFVCHDFASFTIFSILDWQKTKSLNFCSFHDYKTIYKIPMTLPSWPPCRTPIRPLMGYPTTPITANPGRLPKTPLVSRVQIQSWMAGSKQVQEMDQLMGGLKCKLSARVSVKWPWMGHYLTPWNPCCEVEEILSVNQSIMRDTVLQCMMSRIAKEVISAQFLIRFFALHLPLHFYQRKCLLFCLDYKCALFSTPILSALHFHIIALIAL